MVPNDYELFAVLGKAITDIDATIIIDIKGLPPQSKDGSEEWLSLDLLSSTERATQHIDTSHKHLLFQVTCFAKHSEYRKDNSFDAPWRLSAKYRNVLHRAKYPIQSTCLKFFDVKMRYMDLRSSGDYAKELYQSSPILQTHAVLMTASAIIS